MQNKTKRAALGGLFVVAAAMSFAQGRVSGVSVSKIPHGVEVLVNGTDLKTPKGAFIKADRIYTLEFDVPYAGKAEKTQVWLSGLETMTTSTSGEASPKTKLTFKFTKGVLATCSKTEFGYKVDFVSSDQKTALVKATAVTKFPTTQKVISRGTAGQSFVTSHFLAAPIDPAVTTISGSTPKSFLENAAEWIKTLPAAKPEMKKTVSAFNAAPKNTASQVQAQTFAVTSDKKVTTEKKVWTSGTGKKDGEPKISIDFVNTEIVQILKSVARQTNANIVTSPDVTGKLSIKLDNVSIRESLNLVTSLAGLRFSQVGKTYVVTSQAKFLETIRSVQGSQDDMTLSRIVPIYSGQGTQIKVAVLKSVSSENAFGRFELVLPSEKSVVSANQKVSAPGTDKKEEDKGGTNIATETTDTGKDAYVMVIGSPGRLDEVEQLVSSIDHQLCSALGMKVPNSTALVIETYFVHGGRASDLIDALAGKGKTAVGSVELFATPNNSISKQSIVIKGREDEVQNVLKALSQLDSDETTEASVFKMVDLMYADPRSVRELIVANVPGVTCVLAPNGVMNSQTYEKDGMRNQSEQRGTDQPAPQGGGTGATNGQGGGQPQQAGQQSSSSSNDLKQNKDSADAGITLPFEAFEKIAVPMRLIVKGTREQVDRAMEWIKVTDTAPKQVALEMRVMELSREELLQLGINWNLFTSGAIKTITLNNGQTSPSNTIGAGIQGHDISGDVAASLDSISNGTNLISRPNLLCNDGRESEVFVGDAIRYVESIISSQNGPSVTTGTVRAGVRLACFPRIGGSDTLNLDIRTAITYLKGFTTVPQIGGQLPQTSERTAQNTITLKDGETFAIGGLIQQQDVVELSGLPILKDLPFFGQFFRRTKKDKIRTELVIFVTAKVVGPGTSKSVPMSKDSNIMKHKIGLPGGRD